MISTKQKPEEKIIPQDYYDPRLGYTISKYCNTNKIYKQSGKYIRGGIGSPESIVFFHEIFKPIMDGEDQQAYTKRIAHLSNKFCSIEDMAFREFILSASEDNVYWMGEPFDQFQNTYDEHMSWMENKKEYEYKSRKLLYGLDLSVGGK